jgi:gas vesicle protein
MYDTQDSGRNEGQRNQTAINLADIALRGTTMLWNIQLDTLRTLWEMQAHNATAFGAPDYSGLFRSADGSIKRMVETGTSQILSSAHQASDTISEMQRQFGQLMERRSRALSEQMRQRMEEFSEQTRQSLEQVQNMARQGLEQVEQPRPDQTEREEKSARQRKAA